MAWAESKVAMAAATAEAMAAVERGETKVTCQKRQLEAKAKGTALAAVEEVASAAVEATSWAESRVAMTAATA